MHTIDIAIVLVYLAGMIVAPLAFVFKNWETFAVLLLVALGTTGLLKTYWYDKVETH